jgi:hypothetical protein
MTQTKYGIISDVHYNPGLVAPAIEILKLNGAQKLIINGDIGDHQKKLEDSQGYIANILNEVGKSGLESFIQPGTHESFEAYHPVIAYFSKRYPNIINTINFPKIQQADHDLVFLAGADGSVYNNGGYQIVNDNTESGIYPYEKRYVSVHNMNDLKKLVTAPEKTIVICHIPRKFDNPQTCVDMAEFGEVICNFKTDEGKPMKKGTLMNIEAAKQMIARGYLIGIELKKENRGNLELKEVYEKIGIRKAINGHFHESGHRANDRAGNHVEAGQLVDELFYNSGHLDIGQTGIFNVANEKVSYQNINLPDYLK